jgi:hypothetical protein
MDPERPLGGRGCERRRLGREIEKVEHTRGRLPIDHERDGLPRAPKARADQVEREGLRFILHLLQ